MHQPIVVEETFRSSPITWPIGAWITFASTNRTREDIHELSNALPIGFWATFASINRIREDV